MQTPPAAAIADGGSAGLAAAVSLSILTLLIYGYDLANASRIASGPHGELFGVSAVRIEVGLYLGTFASLAAPILQIVLLSRLSNTAR